MPVTALKSPKTVSRVWCRISSSLQFQTSQQEHTHSAITDMRHRLCSSLNRNVRSPTRVTSKGYLQSVRDGYRYALDPMTIAHAGSIVSKTLATGHTISRPRQTVPPYLPLAYWVHLIDEAIVDPLRGSRLSRNLHIEPSQSGPTWRRYVCNHTGTLKV